MARRTILPVALLCLAAVVGMNATAQEDWSPKYVPPQPAGKQQPAQQPPAPQTPTQSAPQTPPPTVKEYNEPETQPAPKAAAPAPAQPAAPPAAQAAPTSAPPSPMTPREKEMREIAERFAPVIYQRMAGTEADHRFDYPTNFDFDGDWVGNNNWEHAADTQYKLWGFVYYSAIESEDHYFLHYALYHPRDWSVVQPAYETVLDKLQEKYKQVVSGEARKEVEFNHENDLEGVLVIVDKWAEGGPAPVAMETVAHNYMLRALTDDARDLTITSGKKRQTLKLENGHPILYVESQKHGIHPWKDETGSDREPIVLMRYGKSTEFSQVRDNTATYDMISICKTFWKRAQETREPNLTFGTVMELGDRFCQVAGAKRSACEFGKVGAAFRGDVARPNSANAPWAWIDKDDPELPPGAWFFDPVLILKRHFGLFDTRETYLYNPYLGTDPDAPASGK